MERPVAAAVSHGAAAVQALRQLPPGFRFHPTDEELVVQYLRRKALSGPLPAAIIPVIHDVAKLDPWDLPGACEGEKYFFSLRQAPARGRKGGGGRRRRAGSGYWKAIGKEKPVFLGSRCDGGGKRQVVGVKTALVFHRGKPSLRTDWIMHEYRLAAVPGGVAEQNKSASHNCMAQPGEWVVPYFSEEQTKKANQEADSQTPGNHATVRRAVNYREDTGLHQPLLSSSSSSSSCVTGISDQEEVSSSQY